MKDGERLRGVNGLPLTTSAHTPPKKKKLLSASACARVYMRAHTDRYFFPFPLKVERNKIFVNVLCVRAKNMFNVH